MIAVLVGDMREKLRELEDNSIDSCVCDPPYHLTSIVKRFGAENAAPAKSKQTGAFARASKGFMGQTWDGGDVAFQPETWAEVFRVLKPGGHLVAFSGTRTYHRMAVAIEDAGFEVRDMIAWHYGQGFPKSKDISKEIDKAAGAEREIIGRNPNARDSGGDRANGWDRPWQDDPNAAAKLVTTPATDAAKQWAGYGTSLKPATEPICLARKPLSEKSIAANVLKWGTGAINVDGCRIEGEPWQAHTATGLASEKFFTKGEAKEIEKRPHDLGRWPANLCHDGSDEVVAGFPAETGLSAGVRGGNSSLTSYGFAEGSMEAVGYGDSGSAARFFYCAKAGKLDRLGSTHPTVKPVALMRWLVRLVTPAGGTVLDPFAGSGSTGIAAFVEGFDATLVELREEAAEDIRRRVDHMQGLGRMTVLEIAKNDLADEAKSKKARGGDLPLFAE